MRLLDFTRQSSDTRGIVTAPRAPPLSKGGALKVARAGRVKGGARGAVTMLRVIANKDITLGAKQITYHRP